MKDTVLILTNSHEAAVALVTERLAEMECQFARINTDELFGRNACVEYPTGKEVVTIGERLNANSIKSVWYRRPEIPIIPEAIPEKYRQFIADEYTTLLWSLWTTLDSFWVNPPLAVRLLEHNKLRQLKDAEKIELRVPRTMITNSPQKLLSFARRHGDRLALKTLRPIRATDANKDLGWVYTSPIHSEQIRGHEEEIKLAPVFAQEYVEKELEFRVTIVGERVFTCAIHSQDSERTKHDWRRYDFQNVKHEVYELPEGVNQKLLALLRTWGLNYGAIDMILTPDGEYVFLEVNPSGQWGWIEHLTGLPISQAIAELLANPPR